MKIDNINNIIDKANKQGLNITILNKINGGKEANIFKISINNQYYAMKVYINQNERGFHNQTDYINGKFYKKSSEIKAINKGNKFSKKLIFNNWIKREFYLLENLYELGASIPKPYYQIENCIIMEYLGDETQVAIRLKDTQQNTIQYINYFNEIMINLKIFRELGIIHGDLSEYNILVRNGKIYIIDFPQALDKKRVPNPDFYINRDIKNIYNYFKNYIEINLQDIYKLFY